MVRHFGKWVVAEKATGTNPQELHFSLAAVLVCVLFLRIYICTSQSKDGFSPVQTSRLSLS